MQSGVVMILSKEKNRNWISKKNSKVNSLEFSEVAT